MTTPTTELRIYVADLAAYNAGHLHGVWIDATLEADDMRDQINAMLAASPVEGAEEYAIHDYEGFGSCSLLDSAGLENVQEIACFIRDYPEFGSALLNYCGDLGEAIEMAENNYCGCYVSLANYAQELTEETAEIPAHLQNYIDYDAMARDLELNGDVFTLDTGYQQVHIFWGR